MNRRQQVKREARRRAQDPKVRRSLRAGWAAKGVVFALTALLAAQVALGRAAEQPSPTGALEYVATGPFGTTILLLLAAGLAVYAVERVAATTVLSGADDGLLERATRALTGVAYLGLGLLAVGVALGGPNASASSSSAPSKATAAVLRLPWGTWIVGAVALALLAYAAAQVWQGLRRDGVEDLRTQQMPRLLRPAATVVSSAGLVGHGLAFGLVGFFLLQSAVTYEPRRAEGLDGALRRLAGQPYGKVMILVTAAGLLAYALYCGLQARYRHVSA